MHGCQNWGNPINSNLLCYGHMLLLAKLYLCWFKVTILLFQSRSSLLFWLDVEWSSSLFPQVTVVFPPQQKQLFHSLIFKKCVSLKEGNRKLKDRFLDRCIWCTIMHRESEPIETSSELVKTAWWGSNPKISCQLYVFINPAYIKNDTTSTLVFSNLEFFILWYGNNFPLAMGTKNFIILDLLYRVFMLEAKHIHINYAIYCGILCLLSFAAGISSIPIVDINYSLQDMYSRR